jgi:hypothetical protein
MIHTEAQMASKAAPPLLVYVRISPGSRWHPVSWAEPKVADTFLVRFEKASYSVPYKFIGSSVVNDRLL